MWILKGLFFLFLLFASVYFFVTNSGQSVDINFFGKSYLGISIYWVVAISFLLGLVTTFILAAFREFKLRREIGSLKRQGAGKDREIAELRTLPLQEMSNEGSNALNTGEDLGD